MTSLSQDQANALITELASLGERAEPHLEYHPHRPPPTVCLGFLTPDPLRFMFNFGRAVASGNLDEETYAAFSTAEVKKELSGRRQVVYFPGIEVLVYE
jgi:hypothetical protein